jgi:hypothetical protein
MASTPPKKKSRGSSASPATPEAAAASQKSARIARENGRLIGLALAGSVVSVAIAFPPLSPVLVTAPIVPPLLKRMRAGDGAAATGALWRWALTVFLTILVSAAFVRARMFSAFPFASQAANAMETVVTGSGGVPVGFVQIVVGMVAFVALAAASLGIAACVLMSIALGTAAAGGAVLFTYGTNVILVSLIACPPWQWALFVAAVFAFVPAAAVGGSKLYGIKRPAGSRERLVRHAIIAGALFVLAVLLRLVLTGPYLSLVQRWTIR